MKKSYLKIFIILLIIAFTALVIFISQRSRDVDLTPPPSAGASYKSITPGESTREGVLDELGSPINSPESNTLMYESTNPNLSNEINLTEDRVTLIKEIVSPSDNKTTEDVTTVYGESPHVLYGPDSTFGFYLYIYPDKGIAYLGHFDEPVLLEIWYFPPTTYNNFKNTWAKQYSETLNPQQ
jgi:hypothetical protein